MSRQNAVVLPTRPGWRVCVVAMVLFAWLSNVPCACQGMARK